jgi:hypothetical protein
MVFSWELLSFPRQAAGKRRRAEIIAFATLMRKMAHLSVAVAGALGTTASGIGCNDLNICGGRAAIIDECG